MVQVCNKSEDLTTGISKFFSFLIYMLVFITFCFPKAGFNYGTTTITYQEILFFIVLLLFFFIYLGKFHNTFGLFKYFLILSLLLLFILIINFPSFSLFYQLAGLVIVLSPISAYYVQCVNKNTVVMIIVFSVIFTCSFAIVQYFFGVQQTKIDGLTIAYGETYYDKPIGLNPDGTALKMPSTFQNGNTFGLFLSGIIPFLCWFRFDDKKKDILRYIGILFGIVGIVLAGSRTAFLSLFISLIIICCIKVPNIIKHRFNVKIVFLFFAFLIIISILLAYNWDVIYNRFFLSIFNDKTGNGRTNLIYETFNYMFDDFNFNTIRYLFFGVEWNNYLWSEGFLCVFSHYGIIFTIIFIFFLAKYLFNRNINIIVKIGLTAIFISFCIDSSFFYMPSLIIYFVIVSLSYSKKMENDL